MADSSPIKTLLVGVGNPIRGDDGVGPLVAEQLAARLGDSAEWLPFMGSGMDLLGLLKGFDRIVLIDCFLHRDLAVGELCRIDVDDARRKVGMRDLSLHHMGVLDAFELASRMGVELPPDIHLYGIGVDKAQAEAYREGLSPEIEQHLPGILTELEAELTVDRGKFTSCRQGCIRSVQPIPVTRG